MATDWDSVTDWDAVGGETPPGDLGTALTTSVTRTMPAGVARGAAAVFDNLGWNEMRDSASGYAGRQEEAASREYQRPADVAPSVMQGWNQGRGALDTIQRAGKALGYGVAEGLGTAVPGLVAGAASASPVGRLVAAVASVPNAALILDGIQKERREQGLDPRLTMTDYANAALQTGIDLIPFGNLLGHSRVMAQPVEEALKEMGQEAATIAGTQMQGGSGQTSDQWQERLVESGAVGAATKGATDFATAPVRAASQGVDAYRNQAPTTPQSQDDAALAERIQRQAEEGNLNLGMRERSVQGGAWEAVASTNKEIRPEANQAIDALRRLARSNGDREGLADINRVASKAFTDQSSSATEQDLQKLEDRYGNLLEGQQLVSLARQRKKLNEFLRPQGTVGGLSSFTRFMDPFEKNASGFQRAVGMLHPYSWAGVPINRVARGIDKLTGNYSPVQKFVKNAAGTPARDFDGESAMDSMVKSRVSAQVDDGTWDVAAQMYNAENGTDFDGKRLKAHLNAQKVLTDAKTAGIKADTLGINRDTADARRTSAQATAGVAGSLATEKATQAGQRTSLGAARLAGLQQGNTNAAAREADRQLSAASQQRLAEIAEEKAAINSAYAQGRLNKQQADAEIHPIEVEARRLRAQATVDRYTKKPGKKAVWKNADHDIPVEVAEEAPQAGPDGRSYQKVSFEGKDSYVPADELATEGEPSTTPAADPAGLGRYFKSQEEGEAWVKTYYDQLHGRWTPPPDTTPNDGAHKAAKGNAAARALVDLKENLNGRDDWGFEAVADTLATLGKMNLKNRTQADREKLWETPHDTLMQTAVGGDSDAKLAVRIGDMLVEAGSDKNNETKAATPASTISPELKAIIEGQNKVLEALAKAMGNQGSGGPLQVNISLDGLKGGLNTPTVVTTGSPATPTPNSVTQPVDPVVAGQDATISPAAAVGGAENVPPSVKEAEGVVKRVKEKKKKQREAGKGGKRTVEETHGERVKAYTIAKALAPQYPNIVPALNSMLQSEDPKERIKGLALESGTDFHSFTGLTNQYAAYYGVSRADAAVTVIQGLDALKVDGTIKGFSYRAFEKKGQQVKDKDSNYLHDAVILWTKGTPEEPTPYFKQMEIAKAHAKMSKLADVSKPHPPLTAENGFKSDISPGIKGLTTNQKANAGRIVNFVNELRKMGMGLHLGLLESIHVSLPNGGAKLQQALSSKKGEDADLQALALLNYQKLEGQLGKDGVLYQEAHAGANGRVYFRNGMAQSQGGDLMKALTRANFTEAAGDRGLELLFQSWGNILGYDKEPIQTRRQKYIEAIPKLLKLADNPFPKTDYEPDVQSLVDGAEGLFQAVALALDTKDLMDFVKARKRGKDLSDPKVIQDIAKNWKTNALAQFDANNNSFQLMGLFMGDQSVLQATGMMPRAGDDKNPELRTVADVYIGPALAAIKGDLKTALGDIAAGSKEAKWLRKVAKPVVSNYVYNAEQQSAANAVRNKFEDEGYAQVSPKWLEGQRENTKKVSGGTEFTHGVNKEGEPNRWRVEPVGKQYALMKIKRDGSGWRKVATFDTEKQALDDQPLKTLAGKLAAGVRKEIAVSYENLVHAMTFFKRAADWAKENGNVALKVPLPDGTVLEYQHDETPGAKGYGHIERPYTRKDGTTGVYRLAREDEVRPSGQGFAAFTTHAHDAWVMRDAFEKSKPKSYNPIHDSHGYHPSEADAGRQAVLESMVALAKVDIFAAIARENGFPTVPFNEAQAIRQKYRDMPQQPRVKDHASWATRKANEELKGKVVLPPANNTLSIDPKQIMTAVS